MHVKLIVLVLESSNAIACMYHILCSQLLPQMLIPFIRLITI